MGCTSVQSRANCACGSRKVVVVDEIVINDESFPTAITVTETQELHSLVESKLPAEVLQELDLYSDFRVLNEGGKLNLNMRKQFYPLALRSSTMIMNDSDVELLPEPTVMLDTFPLDAKSIVMTFSKKDLFDPEAELLDVIDAEPACLGLLTIRWTSSKN